MIALSNCYNTLIMEFKINIKLFSLLLLQACTSVLFPQDIDIAKNVLEKEINAITENEDDFVYLKYTNNDHLEYFLKDNVLEQNEDIEFHDFRKWITKEEHQNLFNENAVKEFRKQFNSIAAELIYILQLPSNVLYYDNCRELVLKNYENGLPLDNGIKSLNISQPIISQDKKYVMFYYSFGYKNSSTGGIKLYKYVDGEYKPYALLDGYIE